LSAIAGQPSGRRAADLWRWTRAATDWHRRPAGLLFDIISRVATTADLSPEERIRLRRAHERLRTASQELQALVATDPIKGRWAPEPAPAPILAAAHQELHRAYATLAADHVQILGQPDEAEAIQVLDAGRPLAFSYEDLILYHGHGSPGGVAHAFKVMQRGFAALDPNGPLERREIMVATAFGGPGARDAWEMVTRAVSRDRYVVDAGLARPERGATLERFVFRIGYRERAVTLILRHGYVTDEFIDLARQDRSPAQETRLDLLKLEMADRVMSSPAADVYDII